MSDVDRQFPARWPWSSVQLHRNRVAQVTSIVEQNEEYIGDVKVPQGDVTDETVEYGQTLKRGIECRGCIVPTLWYPVVKRFGDWTITGGGLWAAHGFKQGDQILVFGALIDLYFPPWAPQEEWDSLPNNMQVGVAWDEEELKFMPWVAKCGV